MNLIVKLGISAIIVVIIFLMTSCVGISGKDYLKHSDPKIYFPNATIYYADGLQPVNAKCPKCKIRAYYVQSIWLNTNDKTLYSQYVCSKSHEWFIAQELTGGPITKFIMIR